MKNWTKFDKNAELCIVQYVCNQRTWMNGKNFGCFFDLKLNTFIDLYLQKCWLNAFSIYLHFKKFWFIWKIWANNQHKTDIHKFEYNQGRMQVFHRVHNSKLNHLTPEKIPPNQYVPQAYQPINLNSILNCSNAI